MGTDPFSSRKNGSVPFAVHVKNVLVLGVGNVLLRDEGVGIRAVGELGRRFCLGEGVELLDGGTAGIELLRFLEGKEHLILIDAIRAGHPPGTVLRVEGEDVPKTFTERISPHQIGISDVLASALLTDALPRSIVLFGVEPADLTTGIELSPVVEAALDKLVGAVAAELRGLGFPAAEREDPAPRPRAWEP